MWIVRLECRSDIGMVTSGMFETARDRWGNYFDSFKGGEDIGFVD